MWTEVYTCVCMCVCVCIDVTGNRAVVCKLSVCVYSIISDIQIWGCTLEGLQRWTLVMEKKKTAGSAKNFPHLSHYLLLLPCIQGELLAALTTCFFIFTRSIFLLQQTTIFHMCEFDATQKTMPHSVPHRITVQFNTPSDRCCERICSRMKQK